MEIVMKVSYIRLWNELNKRSILKKEFRNSSGISSSTYTKLVNDENVSTASLIKICNYLNCQLSDIVECVDDKKI